ncbi:MAG: histidine kinase [Sphingomonadales bacterium]|nr:histidine kinase [Sphingomonadales bacterium]
MAEIALLSVDRAFADRLSLALEGRIPVSLVQAVPPLDAGPCVIVIDEPAIPADRAIAMAIAGMVETAAGRPVVLATENRDADLVLRAIRAGASDVIHRDADNEETGQVLTRLLNTLTTSQARPGQLTLVVGVDAEIPAIFATDLALVRADKRAGHILVDCTMPTSAAEAYLDIQIDYGIASAVADIDRLDSILLSSALARHEPSGLSLLTLDGGTGSEPAGIAPTDIASLIKLLRATCEDIVLCVGSMRHGGLLRDLAAGADGIELVCTQSIRDLESSRRMIEKIGLSADTMKRTRLIVWGHQPGILLDGRRMVDALGLGSFANVPVDTVALRNAVNSGKPLALEDKDSAYVRALRRIGGQRTAVRPLTIAGGPSLTDRLRETVARIAGRRM